MIWFTSDQHFFHKNILQYRSQFSSIEEMNQGIIDRYNALVHKNDIVYMLGDISFGKMEETNDILTQLKGRKILILGNHDRVKMYKPDKLGGHFEAIYDYYELNYNHKKIVLCHYPLESWNKKYYGSIHLYGHVHQKDNLLFPIDNRYHIGVDTNNFKPVSLEQILNK